MEAEDKSTRYPPIDSGKGSTHDYGPSCHWGNVLCTVGGKSGTLFGTTGYCIKDSKCNYLICCLSLEDGLATQPCNVLPISSTIQHIDGCYVLLVTHCYHLDCCDVCKEVTLPCNWLVLVPWNSSACNRDRSGGSSIHGRPIHIYSADRDIHHDCLGYTRIARPIAIQEDSSCSLTGIVIPILIVCSWVQVWYWKNNNTLYEHVLNVTVINDMAHNNLAVALIDQGDYDGALKHCAEALKINPYYTEAYNNMGTVLIKRGEISKAISIFSKAIQINSNNVYAYKCLGQAFISQGNNSEAVKQFTKAIEIEPGDFLAYINMGVALVNLGRLNEAIHQYHKALQIKPDSFEAHYNLANALLSQGKKDEAIDQFKLVLSVDPGNIQAQKILSMLLSNRNK